MEKPTTPPTPNDPIAERGHDAALDDVARIQAALESPHEAHIDVNRDRDPEIPRDEWFAPKKLSHRHRFIAHLAALGHTGVEIAERTGMTQVRISSLLRTAIVSAEVERVRNVIFSRDPDEAMRTMIPKALRVVDEVLTNPQEKASTRVDAAFRLFDRTHGKAVQRVEHGGSLIRELFRRLDAVDETKIIDVTSAAVETNPIDEWADANLPTRSSEGDTR